MHLIDSTTYELKDFSGKIPEYAILSHTWEAEELSFQDIQKRNTNHRLGSAKVEGCCLQARLDGYDYVWIDTCCIDKTSSAELSEAINSMYRWYKEAQVCYAYLSDAHSGEDLQSPDSLFAKSRWFTRGWTLQELIAPTSLVFYGKGWREIGTKLSLQNLISQITGIPVTVLKSGDTESFSLAQRMSWASKRQTTRVEDIAYCLMGLFGVNMPMLYGEGERAFERLQEEIMKTSDDHTLFAWTEPRDNGRRPTGGLLAYAPIAFADSGDIIRSEPVLEGSPYAMTNKGLSIELPLIPIKTQHHRYFAVLNCRRSSNIDCFLAIALEQRSSGYEGYFARKFTGDIYEPSKEQVGKCERRTVYIPQKMVEEPQLWERGLFHITLIFKESGASDSSFTWRFYPQLGKSRQLGDGCFQLEGPRTGILGILKPSREKTAEGFVVVLGHEDGLPWCDVVTDVGNKSLGRVYNSYRDESQVDRIDRVANTLQNRIVSVSGYKKEGERKRVPERLFFTVNMLCIFLFMLVRNVRKEGEPKKKRKWREG